MLSFQDMENIDIPRYVQSQTDGQQEIELHGFSDASLQGYGACIYLRAASKSGVSSVHSSFKFKTHFNKKYDNTKSGSIRKCFVESVDDFG